MKSNTLRYIFLLLIYSLTFSLDAQNSAVPKLVNPSVLERPSYYERPDGMILQNSNVKAQEKLGDSWVVISDRDKNPTYSTATGASRFKEMKFHEAFYVVEEIGNYLRLVKFNPAARSARGRGKLMSNAATFEDYGWAPKDKLLIWTNALIDRKTKFTTKALAVAKPEAISKISRLIKENNLRIFNSPTLLPVFENDKDVRLFSFLYIYKEENDSYLIGKGNTVTSFQYGNQLLGWVSKDVVERWPQRVTLEPNWDSFAAEERITEGVRTTIFNSPSAASTYERSGEVTYGSSLWDLDPYENRREPQWKRLPIFERDAVNKNIVYTGTVSDIFSLTADQGGVKTIKSDEYLSVEKEYNRLRFQKRQINIVFVIDGTTSMKPYIQATAQAIRKSIGNMREGTNNIFNLGGVIYRDFAERDCELGNRLLETKPISKNYDGLIRFLESIQAEDCLDRDKPEAMLYGMEQALKMFGRKNVKEGTIAEQTNLIVLVGDVGDRPGEQSKRLQTVKSSLAKYNCSLIAFQTQNLPVSLSPNPYDDFIYEAKDLLIGSSKIMRAKYQKYTEYETDSPRLIYDQNDQFTFQLNYPNGSPIPGTLIFTDRGNKDPRVQKLSKSIESLIIKTIQRNEELLEELDGELLGIGERGGLAKLNANVLAVIQEFQNVDNSEIIEMATNDNLQLFLKGYTPLRVNSVESDLYKYVLFLSASEFQSLINTLESIWKPGANNTREKLVDGFKDVLASTYGKREAKTMINTLSVSQILERLTDLPTTPNSCNWPIRIQDLENPKLVSNAAIEELKECISEKLQLMKGVLGNPNRYFKSLDDIYYWVPQDIIP